MAQAITLIIKGAKEGDYNEPILIPNSTNWGYIGTKTKQFYRVYAHKIYINGVEVTSDERQKENIKRLNKCLEKIRKVEGLQYNFKQGAVAMSAGKSGVSDIEKRRQIASQKEFGFSAQELAKVFPELVHRDSENDTYTVNYMGMIPVLLEAINEQQNTIEKLNKRIDNLEGEMEEDDDTETNDKNRLGQNIPNPFDRETVIPITLDDNAINAILYIRDFNGEPSGEFLIKERGETSVTIEANTLKPGIYFYSLIVNGKLVKTRRMLIL